MTSDRGTPRTELSDLDAQDLAYALLMDAIDSKGELQTLKGKAKTLFGEFGIKLSDEDLLSIEDELNEMLKLAKDRGLWGKVESAVSKGAETAGSVLEDVGKRMRERRTPGASDIVARIYLHVFRGPYDLLVSTARAALTAVDRMLKKVNVVIVGRHFQLSLSERDVLLGSMVRRLNPAVPVSEPLLGGATPGAARLAATAADRRAPTDAARLAATAVAKKAARRIEFTERGMGHAAKVSKIREERRARAEGRTSR